MIFDYFLPIIPLLPSIYLIFFFSTKLQLIVAITTLISVAGYFVTLSLIPVVAEYTLKKGLSGKDLGKKGTENEDRQVPEALGLVCGTVYIVCAIALQLTFATSDRERTICNSALFSICFMVFLGFCDDTLDLKWRYKLILPTVASLPLLASYTGSTSLYIPSQFIREMLMSREGHFTVLGDILNHLVTIDSEAKGAIVDLGGFFYLFMGLLSVFCTNSINILAGINGLECGQAYVIACSILAFKFYDVHAGGYGDSQLYAICMVLPFIGTSLGLLRYNWFPAQVFVGDTFCYFSGMTFAVVGIHGHFSKTLLLLFLPQIFNFVYSVPQLLKVIPCPRHRLPRADPKTRLLHCSTFPCRADEHRLFKAKPDDTECPNCTLICLVLRALGPMHEKTLCLVLLSIQIASSVIAFAVRYILFDQL